MSFRDIVGHKQVIELLVNSLRSNRIAPAYLFAGPEGVGRFCTARNYAKALNCLNLKDDACDTCPSCLKIDSSNHPDVRVIVPEGLSIKIEQIRELEKEVSLKPFEGRRKVYIIDQAEKMTIPAANCLLKTLEEPPEETILILIATNYFSLLPTIVSRCQLVRFNIIPQEELERVLKERWGYSIEEAHFLVLYSGGKLGKILKMKEERTLEKRERILNFLLSPALGDTEGIFSLAEELSQEERDGIEEILDIILIWYRDLLIFKESGKEKYLINIDKIEELESTASRLSREKLEGAITSIREARSQIRGNVNPQLALEEMLFELAGVSS